MQDRVAPLPSPSPGQHLVREKTAETALLSADIVYDRSMVYEKAVGYVRVSSEEQSKEGVSLDAQEVRVRAYATMRGFDLVQIFREEGVSAGTPLKDRPEGSKAVEMLGKKKAQHIVAVKLDRLFRNASDALTQSERWEKGKCSLHVLDMGGSAVDTSSAMGKMFFLVAAGFAAMERDLTSERTKAALNHLKTGGRVYTHFTPLGFDNVAGKLVPNPDEMQTVLRVQSMRSQGLSLGKIAAFLNAEQVPTKRGGVWHPVTIQSVLNVHKG